MRSTTRTSCRLLTALCVFSLACGDNEGGQDSTYSGSSLSGAEGEAAAGSEGADTSDESSTADESQGEAESAGDGDGDGDGDATSSNPGDGDGDTTTTTTSGDGDGDGDTSTSGDGDGDGGTQPSAGMYSECSPFDTCAPLVNPTCVSAGSESTGFCSITCTSAAQCMPVPGAAPAVCDPATNFCMLDCGGGEACPTGLVCTVGDFGAGNVSRCIEP